LSSFQLVHQSNLATTLTHAIPETTRTFHFWIFMLCVVFLFSFFYIEPTIFCVRCAWQMAKSGEFAWLQVHTGIARLFVCLFVCQASEQTKKEATLKAKHCHSLHSIDTLEKQMGTFCLYSLLSHSVAHTPLYAIPYNSTSA